MAGDPLAGTALVTGASGFIGSHLVRALIQKGVAVHACSLHPEKAWRLKDLASSLTLHALDITSPDRVRALVKDVAPDYVFHLAAYRRTERKPEWVEPTLRHNVMGTVSLLMALLELGRPVKRVVNTGTSEEYGTATPPLHEEMREEPVSPYSVSKTAATHYGELICANFGLPVVTLRPFLTYGPAQDTDMFIPALIRSALAGRDFNMTSGQQWREYNFVSDIVDAFLLAAQEPRAVGEIINIGNGEAQSIGSVADLIVKKCGSSIRLNKGALPHRPGESTLVCDSKKVRRLLGWAPRVCLEEGLDQTIAWYKAHRE